MNKLLNRLLLVIFSFFMMLGVGYSYEKKVHEKITEYSIEKSDLQLYLSGNLQISVADKYNGYPFDQWIIKGSAFEDGEYVGFGEKIWSAAWEEARYTNHFYDPVTGSGLNDELCMKKLASWACINPTGEPSWQWGKDSSGNDYSLIRARHYFKNVLTQTNAGVREENFANMFRSLGQVVHLIQDKSVKPDLR
ncbi:MAG: hypothetical protein RQ824_05290 [bacterium]|nr:hypothetical protein [bacterium]